MNWLHNISIKRKLMLMTMLTSTAALLLTSGLLVGYEVSIFRDTIIREMTAQAKILGGLSSAALTFEEPDSVREMLMELKHEQYILGACIYRNGTEFARFQREGSQVTFPVKEPDKDGAFFYPDRLELCRKIVFKGDVIGTVLLQSDRQVLYSRLLRYVLMLSGVFVVSTLIALLLSSKLQRVISRPIIALSSTAAQVARSGDYTLRAERLGQDELGKLTNTFNQMLAQIQVQDEALAVSRHKLQALVNSIEGVVWECSPDTLQFTFISRQCERLFGYSQEEWRNSPASWHERLHPDDSAKALQRLRDAMERRLPCRQEYRFLSRDGQVVWVRESAAALVEHDKIVAIRGIFLDITAEKNAAERLDDMNRQLVEASRQAGMAEVATGVLHNVGNVLNSVNVSANLISDHIKQLKTDTLGRVCELLEEHNTDLGNYITSDDKGQRIPKFLRQLSDLLHDEKAHLLQEAQNLARNVEHIKEIVAMQQSYARVAGLMEDLPISELVEDGLRITEGGLRRHGITVVRKFIDLPVVRVDKHKILQILVNLVRNAKHALQDSGKPDRALEVETVLSKPGYVAVRVRDNGVGILSENLTRIFSQGFTTKKNGHGFGLHSGAIAAKEMGGSLRAESEGLGHGATFILELPLGNRPVAVEESNNAVASI